MLNSNISGSNNTSVLNTAIGYGATAAAVTAGKYAIQHHVLNSALKVVSADNFEISSLKKIGSDYIQNADIYSLDGVKDFTIAANNKIKLSTGFLKDTLTASKKAVVSKGLKSAAKYGAIFFAAGALLGLCMDSSQKNKSQKTKQ